MQGRNIVLFSSGVSEENGVLYFLTNALQERGYCCCYWRDLFSSSHHKDQIALLPMLLKKIPTFDYAVLLCEGHDETVMVRGGKQSRQPTMRDNVIFEIGLCVMALGINRTILVTDSVVRLPDDLMGKNGQLAIKQFIYTKDSYSAFETAQQALEYIESLRQTAAGIDAYIRTEGSALSPVVIGAASSIACGYVNNFIFRALEWIDRGIVFTDGDETDAVTFPLSKIYVRIRLPRDLNVESVRRSEQLQQQYRKAKTVKSRVRSLVFRCEVENGELHIIDYPTTVGTSYDTAKMILSIDADDENDRDAQIRFTTKELNLFEATARKLLGREYLQSTLEINYPGLSAEERGKIFDRVYDIISNRLTIER